MNFNNLYYEQGYFQTEVSEFFKARLWNEVYSTNWIQDSAENIYKQIPDWYIGKNDFQVKKDGSNRAEYERIIGNELRDKTPQSLIDIGNDLIHEDQFDFLWSYYKEAQLKYIDLWNGSEDIPFHYDTINGCDTLILIYLTEETQWNSEWGGTIEMKKEFDNTIQYQQKVVPNNGTMMVINNANPLVYHKVNGLKNTNVNRYTFSFIYKWF